MHVLYEQLMKHSDGGHPLRGVVLDRAGDRRAGRVLRGRHPQHRRRLDGALPGQVGDPRLRRQRPGLEADHQRPDLHRRRDRDGLPGRGQADGHGDDPVPPDDAGGQGLPDHRGRPRRGRPPAQRERRTVHGALRAEQDGARLARRRLPRRADRDQRGPRLPRRHRRPRHHRGAEKARPRGAARDRPRRPGLRRRRHHPRTDPHQARQPLHDGRRQDRRRRPHRHPRPLLGRRDRLRLGPRRQPPRRQLAARHADLRPPLRRRRRRPRQADRGLAALEEGARGRAGDDRRDLRPREGLRPPRLGDQARPRHGDGQERLGLPRRGRHPAGAGDASAGSRRRPRPPTSTTAARSSTRTSSARSSSAT